MADELSQIYASLGLASPTATANDLSAFQNNVLASNPWNIAAKSLGATQFDGRQWSPTTQVAASFGKNFLSGLLGQYARNDAADQLKTVSNLMPQLRTDPLAVQFPEGIDSSAAETLRANAVIRNQEAKAVEDANLQSALQKVGLAGLMKKSEILGEQSALSEIAAARPVMADSSAQIDNPLASGADSSMVKYKKYFNDLVASGQPPVQAATAARAQVDGEIKANNKSFDEAKAARETGQKLLSLANTAEAGLSQAGQTGSQLASGYEKVISTLAPILPGSQEEAKRQSTGDALLSSIAPDLLVASRPAGVGAMSDPEMKVYLSTGPSPDKTPEQNAMLIEKMKNVAQLNMDYADFLEAYREANAGSTVGAGKKWAEYTKAFPTFKGGEMNISRPGWQDYFSRMANGENPNAVVMRDTIQTGEQQPQPIPTGEVTKSGKKVYIVNGVKGTID
jgi:hypothetical protein